MVIVDFKMKDARKVGIKKNSTGIPLEGIDEHNKV